MRCLLPTTDRLLVPAEFHATLLPPFGDSARWEKVQWVALYGLMGCVVVYLWGRGTAALLTRYANRLEAETVEHL